MYTQVRTKKKFLISQPGTQKNRLNEMVLLSIQKRMLKLMGKKIFTILHSKILFI